MGDMYWHGDGFMAMLESTYDGCCAQSAEVVATKMRDNIATDWPPSSEEGESPHRRTGLLQSRVRVDKKAPCLYWVGAWIKYAVYLELGTDKMGRRPFILKSLMQSSQQVYQIIIGGDSGLPGIRPFSPSFSPAFRPFYQVDLGDAAQGRLF